MRRAGYVVSLVNPRLVDGKPSKNPRYLQIRPDLLDPMSLLRRRAGACDCSSRFRRMSRCYWPVDAVLVGRRNNPAEPAANIRGLAVYNPIHYQELPELFMDFICSLTGKSPSTTGAGSEGALTKSPFNALRPTIDLNNALVSYILTGLGGFSTAAGYIGPKVRVDHDISLLVPEIWCRLTPEERDPEYLIRDGTSGTVDGFRIRRRNDSGQPAGISHHGQVRPDVFRPGLRQSGQGFRRRDSPAGDAGSEAFIDGMKNITQAQQRVAKGYLEDGSIEDACPPLRALLTIMATGSFEGKDANHPDIRAMFTLEYLLASDWYRRRLETKQRKDIALWRRHLEYLDGCGQEAEADIDLQVSASIAKAELERRQFDGVSEVVGGKPGD